MDITTLGSLYQQNGALQSNNLYSALENRGKSPESVPKGGSAFEKVYQAALSDRGTKAPAPERPKIDRSSKLYEQCQALETFIVKDLLQGLRNTVQKSNLIDEGFAGKMYEDMLYDQYAENLSKNAGFGLADQAYLELSGQRGRTITG
jgi:flagellar protein FlgJ